MLVRIIQPSGHVATVFPVGQITEEEDDQCVAVFNISPTEQWSLRGQRIDHRTFEITNQNWEGWELQYAPIDVQRQVLIQRMMEQAHKADVHTLEKILEFLK